MAPNRAAGQIRAHVGDDVDVFDLLADDTPFARLNAVRPATVEANWTRMKMPDGGFRPAFNLGFASDPRSTMVAAVGMNGGAPFFATR